MPIDVAQLPALSRLLDEALDLPEGERAAWLGRLAPEHSHLRPVLERILGGAAGASTGRFAPRPGSPRPGIAVTSHAEGARIGPYRLLRPLGEGGMASVWLAEAAEGDLKRAVALKLAHTWRAGGRIAERFARERDILAQLAHPNIARLYDAGVSENGQPYLALEYVEGRPLLDYADEQRMPLRGRIDLLLQVLEAVGYAHRRLIVHRDLKPSNLLVTGEGQVRLLDFGIAKLLDPAEGEAHETELTQLGGRALTPRYAAPEQVAGEPVTTMTDVYALGVLLHELASGQSPYGDAAETRGLCEHAIVVGKRRRLTQVVPTAAAATARGCASPAQLRAALAGDLATIVGKALERAPADRYPGVEAFADDLRAWLEARPIRARPPSWTYRASLFVRRHRWVVAAGSVGALAIAVAAGVSLTQHRVAVEQQTRAEALRYFMGGLFDGAESRPGTGGKTITAADLLDAGVARANRDFADRPILQGEVLVEIARVYARIGDQARAAELLRRAIEVLEASAPADEPKLHEARGHYANELLIRGDAEGAKALWRSGLANCTRPGPDCLRVRGYAHYSLSWEPGLDPAAARAHADEALRLYAQAHGPDHEVLIQVHDRLARLARERGDLPAVAAHVAEVERLAALTPQNSIEAEDLEFLRATVEADRGRAAGAHERLARVLHTPNDTRRAKVAAEMYGYLAELSCRLGLPGRALEEIEHGLALVPATVPAPRRGILLASQAQALSLDGQHAAARARIGDAYAELARLGFGPAQHGWRYVQYREAQVLGRAGEHDAARRIAGQHLAAVRERARGNPLELIDALDIAGALALGMGRGDEARAAFAEARELVARSLPPDHPAALRNAFLQALARAVDNGGATEVARAATALAATKAAGTPVRQGLQEVAAGGRPADATAFLLML